MGRIVNSWMFCARYAFYRCPPGRKTVLTDTVFQGRTPILLSDIFKRSRKKGLASAKLHSTSFMAHSPHSNCLKFSKQPHKVFSGGISPFFCSELRSHTTSLTHILGGPPYSGIKLESQITLFYAHSGRSLPCLVPNLDQLPHFHAKFWGYFPYRTGIPARYIN